jgi:HK97 gp10 family phage protein
MATFGVKVEGLKELRSRFKQAPEKIEKQVKQIIDESVIAMQNRAKQHAPVDTGALRASITHRPFNYSTGALLMAGNNTTVKYAPYVEFGTGYKFQIPAYPNVNLPDLEAYALTFKKPNPKKQVNLPHRPYLFLAYSEVYSSMIKRIKGIKI